MDWCSVVSEVTNYFMGPLNLTSGTGDAFSKAGAVRKWGYSFPLSHLEEQNFIYIPVIPDSAQQLLDECGPGSVETKLMLLAIGEPFNSL